MRILAGDWSGMIKGAQPGGVILAIASIIYGLFLNLLLLSMSYFRKLYACMHWKTAECLTACRRIVFE